MGLQGGLQTFPEMRQHKDWELEAEDNTGTGKEGESLRSDSLIAFLWRSMQEGVVNTDAREVVSGPHDVILHHSV